MGREIFVKQFDFLVKFMYDKNNFLLEFTMKNKLPSLKSSLFIFLCIAANINAEHPLKKVTTKNAPSVYDVENPVPYS
jgi:hypothetical protein